MNEITYKAVFFFSTCYCSNDYISILMKQRDTDCTTKCTGDNMSLCGGPQNYVSFYLTDETSKSDFLIVYKWN